MGRLVWTFTTNRDIMRLHVKNSFYNVISKEEQEMARKMKTMDGNQAAAHVSYAQKLQLSTRSHRHPLCRSILMSGQQKEEKIFSEQLFM